MEEMQGDLMLDMYMNPHVDKLFEMIRSKALVQVNLFQLSAFFATSIASLLCSLHLDL